MASKAAEEGNLSVMASLAVLASELAAGATRTVLERHCDGRKLKELKNTELRERHG